jgi:hypothetical protein
LLAGEAIGTFVVVALGQVSDLLVGCGLHGPRNGRRTLDRKSGAEQSDDTDEEQRRPVSGAGCQGPAGRAVYGSARPSSLVSSGGISQSRVSVRVSHVLWPFLGVSGGMRPTAQQPPGPPGRALARPSHLETSKIRRSTHEIFRKMGAPFALSPDVSTGREASGREGGRVRTRRPVRPARKLPMLSAARWAQRGSAAPTFPSEPSPSPPRKSWCRS